MHSPPRCAACHCPLSNGYYLQDDALYCDNCWSCVECARPARGGGRCAECSEDEPVDLLPRVLDFLRKLGFEPLTPPSQVVPGAVEAGLLVRELAHAWQCELPPKLRRGVARWVEHRLLLSLGYPELANRLVIDDKGPLQLCLEIQASVGEEEVLGAVRRLHQGPAPASENNR